MRYRCTACDVEWSTANGEQNPVCFNCESDDHVDLAFEIAPWRQGFEL